MAQEKFKTWGGIEVRNRKGQVFLWVKQKNPEMARPYVLFMYKRELLEPDEVARADMGFKVAKQAAQSMGMPMYDFEEIEPQLKEHMKMIGRELEGQKIKKSRREEDIDVDVTDVTTGKRHKLTLGVRVKPIEEAKKEGLI